MSNWLWLSVFQLKMLNLEFCWEETWQCSLAPHWCFGEGSWDTSMAGSISLLWFFFQCQVMQKHQKCRTLLCVSFHLGNKYECGSSSLVWLIVSRPNIQEAILQFRGVSATLIAALSGKSVWEIEKRFQIKWNLVKIVFTLQFGVRVAIFNFLFLHLPVAKRSHS